jgi:hypothetical protein
MPTIAVRDMAIQEQHNDLVLATFGRGFYILDDYTPLRELAMNKAILEQEAHIFPVDDALMYIQTGGKYGQGSTFFTSRNPDFGATFTYYLKEVPMTLKAERQEEEKELFKDKKPIPQPTRDELRLEEAEEAPYLVFAIRDASGAGIRKLYIKASKGLNRINWDLRYSSTNPVRAVNEEGDQVESSSASTLAMPGEYTVELYMVARGEVAQLVDAVSFRAKLLNQATLPAKNYQEVVDFQAEVSEFSRVMSGTRQMAREQQVKLNTIRNVMKQTPGTGASMLADVLALQDQVDDILYRLDGPSATASWEELPPMEMPLNRRLNVMVRTHWSSTAGLTKTETDQLEILREEFPPVLEKLKEVVSGISEIESRLDELKAPWSPGRVPNLD